MGACFHEKDLKQSRVLDFQQANTNNYYSTWALPPLHTKTLNKVQDKPPKISMRAMGVQGETLKNSIPKRKNTDT